MYRKPKPKCPKLTPSLPSRRSRRLQGQTTEYDYDPDVIPAHYVEHVGCLSFLIVLRPCVGTLQPRKPDGPVDTICDNSVDSEIECVFRKSFLSSLKVG